MQQNEKVMFDTYSPAIHLRHDADEISVKS